MSDLIILAAIVIGLFIGLFGSGGSILTMPALMYLLQLEPKVAIVGSLIIVAAVSGFASLPNVYNRSYHTDTIKYFAPSSILASMLGAQVGSWAPSLMQISVFIGLILIAAIKLLLTKPIIHTESAQAHYRLLVLAGMSVGFLTGFIGVGGGFLIIPSLLILARLDLPTAVATSILLIFTQAIIGLLTYLAVAPQLFDLLPWLAILLIIIVSTIGAFVGAKVAQYVSQTMLTKSFAIVLIGVAGFLIIKQLQ